jgi:hypothetical protein
MWVNVVLTTSDQRSQEDYELRPAVAQNQRRSRLRDVATHPARADVVTLDLGEDLATEANV